MEIKNHSEVVLGTIWRWNRLHVLSLEEERYWDNHALPFGWSIVSRAISGSQETDDG